MGDANASQSVAPMGSLPAAFLGEVQAALDSSHATIEGIDAHAEATISSCRPATSTSKRPTRSVSESRRSCIPRSDYGPTLDR